MTAGLQAQGFTRADLDLWPEEGCRHELVDGALIVTPAPGYAHQTVSMELGFLLRSTCPPDLQVVAAPFDVVLGEDTVVQPDLLVARRADFSARELTVAPLLVVEIASPTTRLLDVTVKLARYAEAGVQTYWVVDPVSGRLRVWHLDDAGQLVEVADVDGDTAHHADHPFAVDLPASCRRAAPGNGPAAQSSAG